MNLITNNQAQRDQETKAMIRNVMEQECAKAFAIADMNQDIIKESEVFICEY